jgi:hypothetical protein
MSTRAPMAKRTTHRDDGAGAGFGGEAPRGRSGRSFEKTTPHRGQDSPFTSGS